MAINSRRKGKVGELEAAEVLRTTFGWNCGRTAQHCGNSEDSADLRITEAPSLWVEVKRVQALSVPKTMKKATEQCGRRCPVLLHRTNRSPVGWLLTIRLSDLPRLVHAYDVAQGAALASPPLPHANASQGEGGGQPAGDARPVSRNKRKGKHQNQQGIGTHDVRDSAGGMGSRTAARMPGSV
jgi:hypothetical protein